MIWVLFRESYDFSLFFGSSNLFKTNKENPVNLRRIKDEIYSNLIFICFLPNFLLYIFLPELFVFISLIFSFILSILSIKVTNKIVNSYSTINEIRENAKLFAINNSLSSYNILFISISPILLLIMLLIIFKTFAQHIN